MAPDPLFDIRGKSVWVAGETGMVGAALLRRLAGEECHLLHAPHAVLDLTHQADTMDWLTEHRPDIILLAAAKVGGIGANAAYPAAFLYDNLAIAQNVIHGAYRTGVKKLVFLGSSCIYPRLAPQPIGESALLTGPLEPTNEAYAIAKIAGVKLCAAYRQQYGCDFVSVMPANLYGPGDRFDENHSHVIPSLILKIQAAQATRARSVTLWGTGRPLREFLHVDDLAHAVIRVLTHYSHDLPLNIGSGEEITIRDLAHLIASIFGYTGDILFDPSMPDGTPRKIMDSTRMRALGWIPRIALDEGVRGVCGARVHGQGNQAA